MPPNDPLGFADTVRPRLQGKEAQCPICDRIFGSDSTCEKHKPYAKPKGTTCKDPADIGLEIRVRRGGVAVWVRPNPHWAGQLSSGGNDGARRFEITHAILDNDGSGDEA